MALNVVDAIPAAKRAKARDGIFAYTPNNETIPDPAWVDPEDGSTAPEIPKYTDREWGDEIVWRFLFKIYKRGEKILSDQAADILTSIREEQ